MTHDEFFTAVRDGEVARAYLFQGEEEYIKEKALEALRKKLLPEGLEALNECVLTNPQTMDLIAAAETLPMMADRRLVLVRELAALSPSKAAGDGDEVERLANYLERLPDTACIVFYCKGLPDGRKKLPQALKKKATVVSFERLGDVALGKWIASQLRQHGKAISPENAAFLSFTSGRELMSLSQEIAKLAAFAGDRAEVARADIEAVATPTLECTVFQMVDALAEGREAEAFRLLSAMLEKGEARIGILAMLARQYRNLLQLKRLQSAGTKENELAKRIGVPPFALRRLLQQARRMEEPMLRARLDLCVDSDFFIKSGQMREEVALERAMLRLSPGAVGG